jgi:hypothetical protein
VTNSGGFGMEEYDKAEQEKVKHLVDLHYNAITHLLQLLKKRQEKEADFWNSLLKHLREVKQENGKS